MCKAQKQKLDQTEADIFVASTFRKYIKMTDGDFISVTSVGKGFKCRRM